jgi:hypothetical protein
MGCVMGNRGKISQAMVSQNQNNNPFRSFWMAGFECADHKNISHHRVDYAILTKHLERIDADYRNLEQFKMRTVREGIRWSQVEKKPYVYDWEPVGHMIRSGLGHNVQQLWDICHFGFPDNLSPLDPEFAERFVGVCREFVRYYRSVDPVSTLIITPINEVSFISWLGGDAGHTVPYRTTKGWEVKYQLMKAYILGIEAMLAEDPTIRILTTEPLVHITHHSHAEPRFREKARLMHEAQFQATDILCGRMCPELGGRPEYLDLVGFNFYYNNQWAKEPPPHETLDWKNTDERWRTLAQLMTAGYERYLRPVVLTETSHPKEDRPLWIEMLTVECRKILEAGIPLWGICWYPIIDRPDWDRLHDWHHSGIWDCQPDDESFHRTLHAPSAHALQLAQKKLAALLE